MKSIIFIIVFTIHFGLLAQNEYSCAEMHLKGKVKSITETTQYVYPPQKLATMKMQSPIPTLYSFNQRGDLTEKSIGADINDRIAYLLLRLNRLPNLYRLRR